MHTEQTFDTVTKKVRWIFVIIFLLFADAIRLALKIYAYREVAWSLHVIKGIQCCDI